MVGTALSFFVNNMRCNKVDLLASPRYGAMWAIIPAFVFGATGNKYAMMVSTWIPTLLMVFTAQYTICKEKTVS